MATNLGQFHNGVFVKIVKPSNFFFKYNGWSLDAKTLEGFADDQLIVLAVGKNFNKVMSITAGKVRQVGIKVHYPNVGRQVVVRETQWEPFSASQLREIMRDN